MARSAFARAVPRAFAVLGSSGEAISACCGSIAKVANTPSTQILREKGTEMAGTGEYDKHYPSKVRLATSPPL